MKIDRWTFGLSVFFTGAALITLFVWIPNDIETGVIESFRRRVIIGDAMAPTGVTVAILVVSLFMGLSSIFRIGGRPDLGVAGLDRQSFIFLLRLAVSVGLGLVLMIYTGPLVVEFINALGGEIGTYRQLRASFPYKFIGYGVGGFVMVFGVIRVIENRFSMSAAWASIIAVLVLTILYDVPFDNLLLPPNGD